MLTLNRFGLKSLDWISIIFTKTTIKVTLYTVVFSFLNVNSDSSMSKPVPRPLQSVTKFLSIINHYKALFNRP
jgi:hypothetical protein